MKHWWVNQNQTLKYEIFGGYMWSPKTKQNGNRNQFYDFMTEVSIDDVIFSFAKTSISFIGIATGIARSSNKPNEFNNESWGDEGWLVPVEFYELNKPIKPKNHIENIVPLLPTIYSPLQANGNGNQAVYLTEVPLKLANRLSSILNGQVSRIAEQHASLGLVKYEVSGVDSRVIQEIRQRKDIKVLDKLRLVKSRNGQGLYKDRLRDVEGGCRITGLTDINYLIASHIKPWAKSNDFEKLDGNNGLLLSPHLDKLFDNGYISFANDGDMLISSKLNPDVLKLWGIGEALNAGRFNRQQQEYLKYHRDNAFKE